MVTPVGSSAPFPGPVQGTEVAFQPPFPRRDADKARAPDDPIEAQKRAQDEAERRAEQARADEPPRPRFEPQTIGVQFRVIEEAGITQARVVDRATREVLREVPSTDEILFSVRFGQVVGRNLDTEM